MLLAAAAALSGLATEAAAATDYTWSGRGDGSGRCQTYPMTINVMVDGTKVEGKFQQKGRPERTFSATLDGAGAFKTTAKIGGGNTMNVSGSIAGDKGKVSLRGYCNFGGDLAKK